MNARILREPAFQFRLPVCLCAGLVFPLQLGWSGAPLLALAGYLAVAAVLLALADAVFHPRFYPTGWALIPQAVLGLLGLAGPAALAFFLGAALGPADQRRDEQIEAPIIGELAIGTPSSKCTEGPSSDCRVRAA